MAAYYNEIDPYAAQWLRNLIAAGHIADGEVDERSIADVRSADLAGFEQCHFFAGVAVWSHALRLAGWPDDRPVWTGSCPCQPFSAAGRAGGFADGRHLWPHWSRLIVECRPNVVFGEQVASRDGLAWLDFVCADLEAADYALGAVDTCAAGFGAPHIRQRLYFVADATSDRTTRHAGEEAGARKSRWVESSSGSVMGDAQGKRRAGRKNDGNEGRRERALGHPSAVSLVGDAKRARPQGHERSGDMELHRGTESLRSTAAPSSVNGFWRDAEWIACRDGKARPVEPGVAPLAHGIAGRVGMLRAYGNCICAPQAAAFIRAYDEWRLAA